MRRASAIPAGWHRRQDAQALCGNAYNQEGTVSHYYLLEYSSDGKSWLAVNHRYPSARAALSCRAAHELRAGGFKTRAFRVSP
jgi:hypothetical protein